MQVHGQYPEKPSMKDILSKPHLSIITSVIGRGNSSLGKRHLDRLVDANLDLSILLGNKYCIGHSIRMLLFPDEIRVYELFHL